MSKKLDSQTEAAVGPDVPRLIGWREWVTLPELGIRRLKCKVDTGARTSALHAFYVEKFTENGRSRVRFGIHPEQRSVAVELHCTADVFDERAVTDSGGHSEQRVVIQTPLVLLGQTWPIELTLTSRDSMKFRMLLGRTAMQDRFVVNPSLSYLGGKPRRKKRSRSTA